MILKIDAVYLAVGEDTNHGRLPWPVSSPATFALIVVSLIKV
jgi:hypothetical protein